MRRMLRAGLAKYFTPRTLIQAIVDCIQPQPGELVIDPACGTGGFLLAAHAYISSHFQLDRDQKKHLRYEALRGVELVDGVARLCAMNLFLNSIGPDDGDRTPPIKTDDSLRNEPSIHADVVITNPPFGRTPRSRLSTRRARSTGRRHIQPSRLLHHYLKQTAKLRPAREKPV